MRAKKGLVLGFSLLFVSLLIAATTAEAQQVTVLNEANNVAQLATVTTPGNPKTGSWYQFDPMNIVDDRVSHGVPATVQFYDWVHCFWETDDLAPYQMDLDWGGTTYDLTSLQAYVCAGDGIPPGFPDTDRNVSQVDFFVDYGLGLGFESVGTVFTADTDDVGGFDKTELAGTWNAVSKVRYQFTLDLGANPAFPPRVAEVLAIDPAVPITYQPQGGQQSGLVLTGGGLALTGEGGVMGDETQTNVASQTNGGVAFGTPPYPDPAHTIAHANDGIYGNSNSWIANEPDAGGKAFIGVAFAQARNIDGFAIGRDNNQAGPEYTDRWASTYDYRIPQLDEEYTLQYTTVANPDETTPDGDWSDVGTLDYITPGGTNFAQAGLRHRYTFDEVTGATGVRLIVPFNQQDHGGRGTCIDELEVYTDVVPIPGDTNDDDIVDGTDAQVVAAHWGQTVTEDDYTVGNFNSDTIVDAADAAIMAAHWGDHTEGESVGVPEPTSLGLLISAALAVLLVRRRRHGQP